MTKKKKTHVKRNIIVIVLCIVFLIIGYFGTLYLDQNKNKGDVNLAVTFDDTKTYVIPNTSKLSKEEALIEWPYIINLDNKGEAKGLYQIIIHDIDTSTIKREDLEYCLLLNDKEIISSNLKDIKDNVLYTGNINGLEKQVYKLYIWVTNDIEKDNTYEYSLEFKTIKAGGPGF